MILGLLATFITSFAGELVAFIYSFTQIHNATMLGVSILMASVFAGGILASPLSIYLLERFKPRFIMTMTFVCSGAIVLLSSFCLYDIIYYISSFFLGFFGSVFWSLLSVLIPNTFKSKNLVHVNSVVQSIRNLGYILSPALAGLMSSLFTTESSLLLISMLFFLGIICVEVNFKKRKRDLHVESDESAHEKHVPQEISLRLFTQLFRLKKMKIVLIPLVITICTTSTFNVAFLYLTLNILGYSKVIYGYLSGLLSLGLVLGPLALASFAEKRGASFGACISASVIGFCVFLTGASQSVFWLSCVLFILGVANGIQNTLMSTFIMKVVPKEQRNQLIPTYMLVVQLSVLAGFLIGGIVPMKHVEVLLLISGIIAVIAGIIGARLNYREGEEYALYLS